MSPDRSMPSDRSIHRAGPDDHAAVARLFDGAMLDTDDDRLGRQLAGETGAVLVAGNDPPVGAVALDDATEPVDDINTSPVRITAIAVQPRLRDRGLGRRLVAAAAERAAPRPLTAAFDERVRPFYRACDFAIEPRDGRLWGVRWPA